MSIKKVRFEEQLKATRATARPILYTRQLRSWEIRYFPHTNNISLSPNTRVLSQNMTMAFWNTNISS